MLSIKQEILLLFIMFQEIIYHNVSIVSGHTRQGLKCKVCKLNVHVDCQDKAAKCQQKSRLLRRQKSTSEIDTKVHEFQQAEESK